MAVDKKSDHYTSATNYKDLDGNMKTFTFVDHDRHTTRLKYWKGRTYSPPVLNDYEKLSLEVAEKMGSNPDFIQEFDKLLKKFGRERLKKGTPVNYDQIYSDTYEEKWFKSIKDIYERVQKRTN